MMTIHEESVVLLERDETSAITLDDERVVVITEGETQVISDKTETTVSVEQQSIVVVAVGQQGPQGAPGIGVGGEIFALDVTPTADGIVGDKTYVDAWEIETCLSDTANVRVHVGAHGGNDKYAPSVQINGIHAVMSESSTKRWFTGYADIVLPAGVNIVSIVSDAGGADTVEISVLGAGPSVLSVTFGAYPGAQTELKEGDQINVTITTDPEAVSVTILAAGASNGATLSVVDGVAEGVLTIFNTSGAQPITVKAQNSFGTFGAQFTSSTLTLNQTYPTVGAFTVTYPAGQGALNTGEQATVSGPVTNANLVNYTSDKVSIPNPDFYELNKIVTNEASGYDGAGTNYTITATRLNNDATTVGATLVKIATVPATASITISPSGRLVSSPTGIDYEVRVWPDQTIVTAPGLTASHGAWQGAWVNAGAYWKRYLRISDSVPRGVGTFTGLSLVGLSGITGNNITSGSTYTVGGFSQRAVTFPAFSRVAPLGVGVNVSDQTKVSAQIVGGSVLTRYEDNTVRNGGFYISDAAGNYDPTGSYLALSDTIFAGSNTTGTLQVFVQEVA